MPRALLLVFTLLAAAPALAEEAPRTAGVSLGLRTGYGLPFGKFSGAPDSDTLFDVYSGLLPLWADVAYRWPSGFFVGAHVQYALVQVRGHCPEEIQCGGSDMRLGVDVGWRFQPSANLRWEPWLALGTGYERTAYTLASAEGSLEQTYAGWDIANLQAGADYPLSKALRVGPFATLTVGRYDTLDVRVLNHTGSESLPRRAAHFWFFAGARVQLGL